MSTNRFGSASVLLSNGKVLVSGGSSNGADMKGLMKAAYHDPNPVVMLEHKGLYWSKVKGTDAARSIEPAKDYILPFGIGNLVQQADEDKKENGEAILVIAYGMGVHWAIDLIDQEKISADLINLKTLSPIDYETIYTSVQKTGKALILHEDVLIGGIGGEISANITEHCFEYLDAPVKRVASLDTPVPFAADLENGFLANSKLKEKVLELLNF